MTVKALKITSDDEFIDVQLNDYKDYQKHLEGLMEAISLDQDGIEFTLWVNEEFTYTFGDDKPNRGNVWASFVAASSGRPDVLVQGGIYGNALLTGPADEEGETLDLPEKLATDLRALRDLYETIVIVPIDLDDPEARAAEEEEA